MKNLTLEKFDTSFAFKKAMVRNIEVNGLENTTTQFRAIANVYTKTTCDRCGAVIDEGENFSVSDQDYCENCHDDLFVSWHDVLERKAKEIL